MGVPAAPTKINPTVLCIQENIYSFDLSGPLSQALKTSLIMQMLKAIMLLFGATTSQVQNG